MEKKWLFFLSFDSVRALNACSLRRLIMTPAGRCNEGQDRAEEEGEIRGQSER